MRTTRNYADRFEAHDGGHCYLRARLLGQNVVVDRWPERASLTDLVRLGRWAEQAQKEKKKEPAK